MCKKIIFTVTTRSVLLGGSSSGSDPDQTIATDQSVGTDQTDASLAGDIEVVW